MAHFHLSTSSITFLLYTAFALILGSCANSGSEKSDADRPNILWIVLEDTAPLLGCYGDSVVPTPHIDQLAARGIIYTNAIMPAPVCSPCRSSIITGIMSTTLGTHNHHSARTPESAIYLPENIVTIPELFKAAGYFTFNNGKDDYNFTYERKDLYDQEYSQHPLYGKRGDAVEIASLTGSTPFFGQIQLSGGKEIFNPTFKDNVKKPTDKTSIKLPPYLPNHPVIVEEYANHLDAIQITDEKVGDIMDQLESSGLLDNTIIFFFSDHGMRLTRHKQFLYEGGLRVPLIIADHRGTNKLKSGMREDALVSGIDLGPSALALAGISIPDFIEGRNIFGPEGEREFVISTRDRCDFTIDRIRSVRSQDYKYIRNFMLDRPYMQLTYMDADAVPFVVTMKELHEGGKLNPIQSLFFRDVRPAEELYKLQEDPYEINNLADDPAYADVLQQHAAILENWIMATDDQGQYPEKEAGLKLMLGIWGDHAVGPEYDALREKYSNLAGSQYPLKSSKWQKITE